MPQKRMIYELLFPEPAMDGRTGRVMGTIEGRGARVPVVDCPKPMSGFGKGCLLSQCCSCTSCDGIEVRFITCSYVPSADEAEQMKQAEAQAQAQGGIPQNPIQQGHPTAKGPSPPVPPNVFDPKKK